VNRLQAPAQSLAGGSGSTVHDALPRNSPDCAGRLRPSLPSFCCLRGCPDANEEPNPGRFVPPAYVLPGIFCSPSGKVKRQLGDGPRALREFDLPSTPGGAQGASVCVHVPGPREIFGNLASPHPRRTPGAPFFLHRGTLEKPPPGGLQVPPTSHMKCVPSPWLTRPVGCGRLSRRKGEVPTR